IEPDPGHSNPFRIGADRSAENRHYHLTFELEAGNAVALNPEAMQAPAYRAPGNTRVGGPFGFSGPWGDGAFTPSTLWLRIYAPDTDTDIMGGVSLPRVMLELDTGEQFWLQPDKTLAVERQTQMAAAGRIAPHEPYPFLGPELGWFKIFGLRLRRSESSAYLHSWSMGPAETSERKQQIRDVYMLFFNRGTAATPPGNYESSATCCNYVSYLSRPCVLGPEKVYVITGKMPTTPATRDGEPVMTAAEARYWSISQYGAGEDDNYPISVHYGSLMDDEITVNENNEYIIVFSRREERPSNATAANGVTWQDWGPASRQTLTIRWMSIMPEWHLPGFAPDEYNIPWLTGGWAEADYDQSLVGENNPGIMRDYHPVIHYMTKQEFEALGDDI
ncbi:MAG: hypothetical protein KAX80_08760, partial [Planctomycetes bacterium]|nr:hypothetical protein [Planctomycetota bacterium]